MIIIPLHGPKKSEMNENIAEKFRVNQYFMKYYRTLVHLKSMMKFQSENIIKAYYRGGGGGGNFGSRTQK